MEGITVDKSNATIEEPILSRFPRYIHGREVVFDLDDDTCIIKEVDGKDLEWPEEKDPFDVGLWELSNKAISAENKILKSNNSMYEKIIVGCCFSILVLALALIKLV